MALTKRDEERVVRMLETAAEEIRTSNERLIEDRFKRNETVTNCHATTLDMLMKDTARLDRDIDSMRGIHQRYRIGIWMWIALAFATASTMGLVAITKMMQ
jgi:hypothetical protein